MEIVSFDIAKKLKEKGFTISTKDIIGMYNELGVFHTLTTSADYITCDNNVKYRCYYNYDDFDDNDFVAPTVSQALKWLRENHKLDISTKPYPCEDGVMWEYEVRCCSPILVFVIVNKTGFKKPEQAALTAIDYVLDNLI